jgi:hypothetical protein
MSSPVAEAVEHFDAAVWRAAQARTQPEQRGALKEALGHLYVLRDYREGQLGRDRYRPLAANCLGGRVTQGLACLRNALTHHLTQPAHPIRSDAYSDTYTTMYGVPVWRRVNDIPDPPRNLTSGNNDALAYECEVAGEDVFSTLRAARRFLVEPDVLGLLE